MDDRASAAHLGAFMAVGFACLALATITWNRRATTRGAFPLFATLLCTSAVLIPYALSYSAAISPARRSWLIDVTYVGWLFMPVSYLAFVARLTGRARWLTSRVLTGMVLVATSLSLLAVSPWASEWFFDGPRDPITYLVIGGTGYWAFIVFANLCLAAATWIVVRTVRASHTLDRRQVTLILITVALPWILSFASNVNLRFFGSDPTVLTLVVCSSFAYLAAQFRLFDLRPMAAAEQTVASDEGVVVLDASGRVTEMNATAVRLLGPGHSPAMGRAVEELWAHQPGVVAALRGAAVDGVEIPSAAGDAVLAFSREPIRDAGGRTVGHVVFVRRSVRTTAVASDAER